MALSPWQLVIKPATVVTSKMPIVSACNQAQEYITQAAVVGFTQKYIPLDIDVKAMIVTTGNSGDRSGMHHHDDGSFRYIMSGTYKIRVEHKGRVTTDILESDEWIYIPGGASYETEAVSDVRIMHLYCVTNCGK